MKENETNKWIDKVLASAQGKEVPEVNPFLFTRIEQKFSEQKTLLHPDTRFRWVMAATVLLILNIGAILYTGSEATNEIAAAVSYQELSESYFENDSTQTVFYNSF